MKTFLPGLLLIGLLTVPAYGQAHIIKQRAKELNQQNNARQGISTPPPAAPGRPTAPGAQPVPGAPPAAAAPQVANPETLRRYDVGRIKADLALFKPGAAVTATQTDRLAADLTGASRGVARPTSQTVTQLARNLGNVMVVAKLSATEQAQLAEDLATVLNPTGTTASKAQAAISGIELKLQRAGADRRTSTAITDDLRSIAKEVQAAR